MKNFFKKWVWLSIALLLGGGYILGESFLSLDSEGKNGKSAYDETISVIVSSTNQDQDKMIQLGAKEAAKELWVNVNFAEPIKENDISDQKALIDAAIHQKVSAIILEPDNAKELMSSVEQAVKAGIPVVIINSEVESDQKISVIETNNQLATALAARHMAELIGKQGKVAIIKYDNGNDSELDREKGFRDEIQKYPGIKTLDNLYSDRDGTDVAKITQDIITKDPDIKGIYATNAISTIGVAMEVNSKGLKNQVVVGGFDSSKDGIALLEQGVIKVLTVPNYFKMGYLGVKQAVQVVNRVAIEKKIYTETTLITKENMNTQENQMLLYPFGK